MRLIFDTYSWVEYFSGTAMGEKVGVYLENNEIFTPSIVLVELSCKATKEKWNFKYILEFIKMHSFITSLNEEIIILCGKIYVAMKKKNKNFSLPDAIILTSAIKLNGKVLTGDEHFRDIREAILIK